MSAEILQIVTAPWLETALRTRQLPDPADYKLPCLRIKNTARPDPETAARLDRIRAEAVGKRWQAEEEELLELEEAQAVAAGATASEEEEELLDEPEGACPFPTELSSVFDE